jgi:sterol desaturase/sphingolipid hydroxylase (fatty acid hydroxylase superfamily)
MILLILIIGIVHHFYNFLNIYFINNDICLTIAMFSILYHSIYWILGFLFEILDNNSNFSNIKEKYKLKTRFSVISYNELIKNCILNQTIQLLCTALISFYFIKNDFNKSLPNTIFWIIIYYLYYDITFYFGHWLMHNNQFIRNFTNHNLHHSTYANQVFINKF